MRTVVFAASFVFGLGITIYALFVWNNFPADLCLGAPPLPYSAGCISLMRPEYMLVNILLGAILTVASLGGLLWTAIISPRRRKITLTNPK